MGIRDDIRAEGSLVVSVDTLDVGDLLASIYELLKSYDELYDLRDDILDVFNIEPNKVSIYNGEAYIIEGKEEEAEELLYEGCFTELQELCPEGYYFGSYEGNNSCIGFFECN